MNTNQVIEVGDEQFVPCEFSEATGVINNGKYIPLDRLGGGVS